MPTPAPLDRRVFLAHVGRITLGMAVLGVGAACGTSSDEGTRPGTTPTAAGTTPPGQGLGDQGWHRVPLGFVSAYVLLREGTAAVVDTGVEGSTGDIESVLTAAGAGWDAVAHVLLTHRHPDHVGSLAAVLERTPGAVAYAGKDDIAAITARQEITAVGDGDQVFGLEVVATPGHTAGHISVLDPVGGVLVAGDALNGVGGAVAGPNPDFSEDMAQAVASVRKLAGLSFDTVLFGHGEPVEGDASAQVAALAGEL